MKARGSAPAIHPTAELARLAVAVLSGGPKAARRVALELVVDDLGLPATVGVLELREAIRREAGGAYYVTAEGRKAIDSAAPEEEVARVCHATTHTFPRPVPDFRGIIR